MKWSEHIDNLKELSNEMGNISGGWNGKDDQFMVGGDTYTEEDAHYADDVVEKCNDLIKLLKEDSQ